MQTIYPVIKQANKAMVGILILTHQKVYNLQYMVKINIMVGTLIVDLYLMTPKNPNIHGKLKLSTSIILNDPSEYKGEFEIEFPIEGKKGYKREVVKQLDLLDLF